MTTEHNLLATAAKSHGDRLALISFEKSLTYAELYASATATANNLAEMGVKKGSYGAVICENSADLVILLHALWQLGAVAAPINPKFPPDYLESLLLDVGFKFTVLPEDLSAIVSHESYFQESHRPPELALDDPATIIYTSGSSARPKAAVHSLGCHYFSAVGSNQNICLNEQSRWLLSLPLCHVGGIAILFRTLLSGAAVVIPDKTQNVMEVIEQLQVTHLSLVPTQLHRLLDSNECSPGSKLPTIIIGGAKMPPALARRAMDASLPIHTSYGLTEMASQVTTTPLGATLEELTTSGKLLSHRELMISNDGEILVRGKTLFRGYLTGGQILSPLDSEGWFHTGDLGRLDASGNLNVTGRRDNMFLSGGENVQPEEIESVMLEKFGFEQVMVVPVASDEYGNRPVAFIRGEFDESVIRQELKKFLPGFNLPDAFYAWPQESENNPLKPSREEFTRLAKELARETNQPDSSK